MSDVMLFGVLKMPYEMAMGHELSRRQYWQRAQEAAERLERAEAELARLREQEPVAWKHDCAALCTNDVELWIDACPHCGKPRTAAPPAQPAEPQCSPSQAKSLALLDLDSVEHMQGGANGPTIRLRGFINAQTGPTAPQPPIDNAFVAEGCEQFSAPAESAPAAVPCCGKYEACSHACTPRGKWLGRREAESERADRAKVKE